MDGVVDQVLNGLRFVIKAGNRRGDDGAHLTQLGHGAQVAEMEGRFADHQDKAAALFQSHVCGTGDEIVRDAMGDCRHSVDGAGSDNHGRDGKTAGSDGGANVESGIGNVGNLSKICCGFLNFQKGSPLRGAGKYQMRLCVRVISEHCKQAPAIDGPRGAGNRDNNS